MLVSAVRVSELRRRGGEGGGTVETHNDMALKGLGRARTKGGRDEPSQTCPPTAKQDEAEGHAAQEVDSSFA